VSLRIARLAAGLAVVPLLAACRGSTEGVGAISLTFDLRDAAPGWEAGFAEVAVSQEANVEFVADHRPLPEPLGPGRKALYQSGWNVSDDLFMFFKHRVAGLNPGVAYDATFEVGIVSQAHQGCDVGIGVSVMVKAGATGVEPQRVAVDGYYVMNVDIGSGALDGGAAALVLGDIRNGLPGCPSVSPQYAEKTLSSGSATLPVTVAADGSLWLLIATDSAFESPHQLYFTAVTVTLRRR
jgi:hypothetical protein